MTAYNAKDPYEPDLQIPRGVWSKLGDICGTAAQEGNYGGSVPVTRSTFKALGPFFWNPAVCM